MDDRGSRGGDSIVTTSFFPFARCFSRCWRTGNRVSSLNPQNFRIAIREMDSPNQGSIISICNGNVIRDPARSAYTFYTSLPSFPSRSSRTGRVFVSFYAGEKCNESKTYVVKLSSSPRTESRECRSRLKARCWSRAYPIALSAILSLTANARP